jgi:hypothetical protein
LEIEKLHQYRFMDIQSFLGLIGGFVALGYFYFSGAIEPFGIWTGLILGTLAGCVIIMIWRNLAKKGQFIIGENTGTFRFRIWHFGILVVVGCFLGIIIAALLKQYPEIDIENLLATFLIFGWIGLFGPATLGIFWIQRKYGERFYFS